MAAPERRERIVSPDTDVCIEGAPRSANSFASWSFRARNLGARVASHAHVPAHVHRAVDHGVPCAVLIRNPLDVVTSIVLMTGGERSGRVAFYAYTNFYSRIMELRERVVVAEFPEVIEDPLVIARRLNDFYGTTFGGEPLSDHERSHVLERMELVDRRRGRGDAALNVPGATKQSLKRLVRERLATHPSLRGAEEVYRAFLVG
jgi:hypothetical protein